MTLPVNTIVTKELQVRGTFRFHSEFAEAVHLMGHGMINVKPLITATLPFTEARQAFELAGDRLQSIKVQIIFDNSNK